MTRIVLDIKDHAEEEEEEEDMDVYEENDLILCKTKDGKIRSCGFSVNNILLREGKPPMMTMNRGDDDDDKQNNKVSDLFRHLAIPAGFFYIQAKSSPMKNNYIDEEDAVEEDLYERLLALASVTNHNDSHRKKRGTKKISRAHGAKHSRKQGI